jgi:hypothetical protein
MRLSTQRRRSAFFLMCAATAGCGHHAACTRVPLQADVRAATSPPREVANLAEERRNQLRALDLGSARITVSAPRREAARVTLTSSQQRRLMEILDAPSSYYEDPGAAGCVCDGV